MAAPGRSRRLSVNREQTMPGADQRVEDRRRKGRRAHKDEVHAALSVAAVTAPRPGR